MSEHTFVRAPALVREKQKALKSYAELRRRVETAFREGRARAEGAVEQEKVRTSWEVGRLIHTHFLFHKDRAGYGERTVKRLSEDLGKNPLDLYYSLRFARAYPIVSTWKQLDWSHYKRLLAVEDAGQRKVLTDEAARLGWNVQELERKIKAARDGRRADLRRNGTALRPSRRQAGRPRKRFLPKRGGLHTYRLVRSQAGAKDELLIDTGFHQYLEFEKAAKILDISKRAFNKFKEEEIFELKGSSPRPARLPRATRRDLFTYRGFLERVVDADTLWLEVHLGFGLRRREKLRLRGIDAPELSTRAGKQARRFVETELAGAPYLTVTTTKPEKFGRYLTDLYYSGPDGKEICLNQRLLERGLARPAE